MPNQEPSHSDILRELGELRGQMTAITILVTQKREDLNTAFALIRALEGAAAKQGDVNELEQRLRKAEDKIANWAGICIAISFALSALPSVYNTFIAPHKPEPRPSALLRLIPWTTTAQSAESMKSTPKPGM